jgi:DNA-binding MarR family transcriptional regulator
MAEELAPIDELDRVIHEPARLKIMTQLYIVEQGDFIYLLHQTGLTRGNLSTHMSKLEEVGYIEVIKEFIERKPVTMLRLTKEGREAFLRYRENMQMVLRASD